MLAGTEGDAFQRLQGLHPAALPGGREGQLTVGFDHGDILEAQGGHAQWVQRLEDCFLGGKRQQRRIG